MLKVINKKKRLGISGGGPYLIREWQRAQLMNADRASEDRSNQSVISHLRQRDESHIVRKIGCYDFRYCQREASLAHAAGSG
jgi:hypothetical protein